MTYVLLAAGLGLLVWGGEWLVRGASRLAAGFGISPLIIGVTIVAFGTSMPEMVVSTKAAWVGQADIALGNVVGSNIFNILDIPVMVAVAVACLPIFFTGHRIARWEGALFFGYYVAYVAYLVLAAQEHAALRPFSAGMLWFILPLTAVTLGVVAWRSARRQT